METWGCEEGIKVFVSLADVGAIFVKFVCPNREANTIFRGNSLATRCIDDMMKIVGKNYLTVTLKPVIDEVTDTSNNMCIPKYVSG